MIVARDGFRIALVLVLSVLSLSLPSRGQAAENCPPSLDSNFTCLATYSGIGNVLASLVGPGPVASSERLYQSYIYGKTLDIVAIDPESGHHQVFSSPVPGENGAWALAWGGDGNLYVGTLPHAHILQLNPRSGSIIDLGRPSDSEEYIWSLTQASDGKIYGGTYPSAKLVRFDPATGRSEDLGRMHPKEQYAVSVVASDDGFVYVGVGYRAHVIAYDIHSGEHRDLLPLQEQVTGLAYVHRHSDGNIYASISGKYFRVQGWDLTVIDSADVPSTIPSNRLQDGRIILQAGDGVLRIQDAKSNRIAEYPFRYSGKELDVFRIGVGPDGMLYGSGYMPAHFFQVDLSSAKVAPLGTFGGGEFYNFLSLGKNLLGAAYVGLSPLMVYDPRKPYHAGKDLHANPRLVEFSEQSASWRPMAMINGPAGKVYLGSQAAYGKLGGPLVVWDPATNRVETYPHLIRDESVISLTSTDGLIVGGTTVYGGGGSHKTQTQATVFIWDPSTKRVALESDINASTITDLTSRMGLVYGFADDKLFMLDPQSHKIIMTNESIPDLIYNSVALAPDGCLWALSRDGIVMIDPAAQSARVRARPPEPITAGFAAQWPHLYYASGPRIYRYTLPTDAYCAPGNGR